MLLQEKDSNRSTKEKCNKDKIIENREVSETLLKKVNTKDQFYFWMIVCLKILNQPKLRMA